MSSPSSAPTSLVSNEPVVVGHAVLWLFLNVGAFIVGHTHLVTSSQWSSVSTFVVPLVTAFVLSVSATLMRKYVSPFWKSVLKEGGKLGVDTSVLTGLPEVQSFFADLGLDSQGNPVPIVTPPAQVAPSDPAPLPAPAV